MREWRIHTVLPPAADSVQAAAELFDAEDIHSQLERILQSAHFRDSLRLTSFLKFVVETTLTGKPESIKAYTIAVEALGRTSDFDPQHDPIVRVEAGRLRQALTRYYSEAGRDDPLVIELPRGTYVPNFRRRMTAGATPHIDRIIDSSAEGSVAALSPEPDFGRAEQIDFEAEEPFGRAQQFDHDVIVSHKLAEAERDPMADVSDVWDSTRRMLSQSREILAESDKLDSARPRSPPASPALFARKNARAANAVIADHMGAHLRLVKTSFAAIALLCILEVLFTIDRPLIGEVGRGLFGTLWPASNATILHSQGVEAAPIISVEPLAVQGTPPADAASATIVRDRMIDLFSRFDDTTVVGVPLQDSTQPAAPASGVAPPSFYQLAGSIQYSLDNTMLIVVRLIDSADGMVVWSKTYQRKSKPASGKGRIIGDAARLLLDPMGVIQARERIKRATANPMQDTYRCILDANAYLHSFDPSQYQPVSDCLVRASAQYPAAVSVFADLAFVYLRNYQFGISSQPGDRSMLDNAYRMAAHAAEIKPNSAFAQLALQEALLAKGDIAQAKIAGDNSFQLNPNNSAVAFGHAWLLIMTNRIDEGVALLSQNAAETSNNWIGYHLLMALGCYLKGDLKTAAVETRRIASPFFPPGLLLDAIVASKAGERARAQGDISMLDQFYPAWRENPRASVARLMPDPAMAERIAADFEAAAATSSQ